MKMWLLRWLIDDLYEIGLRNNDHILFDNAIVMWDAMYEIERRTKNGKR